MMGEFSTDTIRAILGEQVLFAIILIGVLAWAIKSAAESKEYVAKMLGPIGRVIRRSKERKEKIEEEKLHDKARELLVAAGGVVEPPDYGVVKAQLANVLSEVKSQTELIKAIQLENRGLRAYIIHDESWHFEDDLVAAKENREAKPRIPYDQFMADFMRRNGQAGLGIGLATS